MGERWGKALILTTTFLTINIDYARSLTLGWLYLFLSMKIPRTHMKMLHFLFFV